ncbi:ABC transporter permease [Dactylosporangium sp. NPDC051485]|uniref:ABC transporter permease n=1 Tax=Dactylosporangium sp. NPDC051485 TaxID=3154846 RepID=UPI00343E402E
MPSSAPDTRLADLGTEPDPGTEAGPSGTTRRLRGRRIPPTVVLSVLVIAVVLVSAVVPSLLAGQDPINGVPSDKLASMSGTHWLGTDYLGRDMYSRIVHGARTSVLSAILAVAVAVSLGTVTGLAAALGPRWLETPLMRLIDVLLAIPSLLLAMVFVAAFGFSSANAAVAVGLSMIATFARVARIEALRVRSAPYIEAAEIAGTTRVGVVVAHLLPNIATTLISLAVLEFGAAILALSTLSFLGFGAQPPNPEWGQLVAEGANFFYAAPWLVYAPAAVVVIVVLAVNRLSTYLDARAFDESL